MTRRHRPGSVPALLLPACVFVGSDEEAAHARALLQDLGIAAELVRGAGNPALGFFGDGFPEALCGSWLARVTVAPADQDRAAAALAGVATDGSGDPLDFGASPALLAARIDPAELPLLLDLVAEVAAAYGERLQALKLVGSRARGDHRPDSDWDLLVFLDTCDHEVEGPRTAALAAALEERHRCAELSLSPLSREQFLGLDAEYEGITAAFRRDAIALGPRVRRPA